MTQPLFSPRVNFTNAVKLTGELLVRTEQKIMRDQVGCLGRLESAGLESLDSGECCT